MAACSDNKKDVWNKASIECFALIRLKLNYKDTTDHNDIYGSKYCGHNIWIKNERSMSMIRKEYQIGLNDHWILSVLH